MYDGGVKSGAKRIVKLIFVLFAIYMIVDLGRVVLMHIDRDGFIIAPKDCDNLGAMSILEKAGVFGDRGKICEAEEDEESDEETEESKEEAEE